MADVSSVVIVGASLAGIRAAGALRRAKFAGRVTLIGAEVHLPYDRPPLSKQVLAGQWEPARAALQSEADIAKLGLDLRLGIRATAFEAATRTVTLERGEHVTADAVILATGAAPRMLPGLQALKGVHVLRTLDDCLAIRAAMERGARVAVIGAGFIGAEVAAAARMRGLEVTLLEALSEPLERALGARVGAACAVLHRAHGADVRTGVSVAGVEGAEGRVGAVVLGDGERVPADLVVVGIGVRPETAWLDGSGLTLDDGIVCDSTLRAAPGVYAAGDICRWHNPLFDEVMRVEHWTNAVEQGIAAARNVLRGEQEAQPYAPVPYVWSDQYDVSIQVVGHPHADDALRVRHGAIEDGEFLALYGRGERFTGAVSFGLQRLLGDYRRLLASGATLAEAVAHEVEDD